MAERKLRGVDMLFFIDLAGGTDYSLVICLLTQQLGITNAIIDAASKCGPDSQPGKQANSLSFSGQIMLDPAADRTSAFDLYTAAQDKTEFSWKYAVASPVVGEDILYTGRGFLSEFTQSADLDNPAAFNATVGVVGSVTAAIAA